MSRAGIRGSPQPESHSRRPNVIRIHNFPRRWFGPSKPPEPGRLFSSGNGGLPFGTPCDGEGYLTIRAGLLVADEAWDLAGDSGFRFAAGEECARSPVELLNILAVGETVVAEGGRQQV